MDVLVPALLVIVAAGLGIAGGFVLSRRGVIGGASLSQAQLQAEQVIAEAEANKKELLLEAKEEAIRRARSIINTARLSADEEARRLITLAVQRLAGDHIGETTVTSVPIPSEDMKGRIIGREGRNIRALEAATGVDLIIDETP